MRKFFLIFFVSIVCLISFAGTTSAYGPGCTANNGTTDPAATGIVPCGVSKWPAYTPNSNCSDGAWQGVYPSEMACYQAYGQGVPGFPLCPCEFGHFFIMLVRIYTFIIWWLATPIAALLIMAGGILMMVSGGNPGLIDRGKGIIKGTVIGLIFIFASWVIVNLVFMALGYGGMWWTF